MRSLVVSCLAFAGVFMLAGPGWALLAGALLVAVAWRREPDWAVLQTRALAVVSKLRAAPRRAVAMTGAAGGLVSLPAGLALATGVGVGVAVGGGLLIGLGLLSGWNA